MEFTFAGQDWTYAKTQFAKGNIAMCYGFHDTIQQFTGYDGNFGVAPFPSKTGTTSYTNVAIPQFINFIPSQYQKEADKILFFVLLPGISRKRGPFHVIFLGSFFGNGLYGLYIKFRIAVGAFHHLQIAVKFNRAITAGTFEFL